MRDPYDILGVTRDASLQQIKKAYKSLAKKAATLPDTQNDVRMEELNNAYDAIMSERGDSAYNGGEYGGTYNNYHYSASYNDNYDDVRRLINEARYSDAETLLNGVPADRRNAEWHYLKGRVLYNKGWLEDASREFEAAYNAEPSNREYKSAYENAFSKRTGGYRSAGGSAGGDGCGCGGCELCSGLLCADCCCESMGGDLIPCC